MKDVIPTIMNEINSVMKQVKQSEIEAAMPYITKDRRIYTIGAGRSGFQAKALAMRLMQIGYTDYVVGETVTPSTKKGDTMIAISGSGNTGIVMDAVTKAKSLGVTIIGFTSDPNGKLAQTADVTVIVPGATKSGAGIHSIQLLSTLFDQTVEITLDTLCLLLSERDHTTNEEAKAQHANLE